MLKIYNILLILIGVFIVSSCNQNNNSDNDVSEDALAIKGNGSYEFSKVEIEDLPHLKLTLSRGAFHYDYFQLTGNELKFIPSNSDSITEKTDYNKESKVILEENTALSIYNNLIENSVFEMNSVYESPTTCNSILEIELTIYDKKITILCKDFERGCPKFISSLEGKLIELHGKNLKRFILPG